MATKNKNQAKSYFIVSGNINGNQQEPLLHMKAADADVAIIGTVLGALGEMGYVKPDGNFKDCIIVEMTVASKKGSHCHGPWKATDFAEIIDQCDLDEHVTTITLRNRRSRHTFAEWTVTKVRM
ncbi:MAG: hypothetical protein IKA48_01100 [Fibrobacter sp.]|nr:hypothetical protein [Fibrobacter sp.]